MTPGAEQPRKDRSGTSWGHKLTVSAYFEGEVSDAQVALAIRLLNNAWHDAVFIGVQVDEVRDEPQDQVAT